ncbi:Rab proteins geranylgeranyltransferase component A [Yarrowia sp. E02]|nr:Rab proteins geranylgeranyltransferase component A [Yarrowia sp. E02]
MSSFSASSVSKRGSVVPPLAEDPAFVDSCDVLICGTGIVESILAAALAWQGSNVAHLDRNAIYGDSSAVLNLDELPRWVDEVNYESAVFSNAKLYQPRPLDSKKYFVDLTPRVLFAKSDMLQLLLKSRVYKYLEFRSLTNFHTYENDSFEKVPASKQDIFTSQQMSPGVKRQLMKFIKFTVEWERLYNVWGPYRDKPVGEFMTKEFNLEQAQIDELVQSIGLCSSNDVATPVALHRIKRYLVSLETYGAFPVVYSMYGSASELSQGFCRSAAVGGAVYKLNATLTGLDVDSKTAIFNDGSKVRWSEKLVVSEAQITEQVRAKMPSSNPAYQINHLTVIVNMDCKEWFAEGEDAAIIVFPVGSLSSGNTKTVQAICYGAESGQVPRGQCIWYLSTVQGGAAGQRDLEEALSKMEAAILRESTEDFEFQVDQSDVIFTPSGDPVLSSVKLGKSMKDFVPDKKLTYLIKLSYTQKTSIPPLEESIKDVAKNDADESPVIVTSGAPTEITYDGIVEQVKKIYAQIVGSDDDFFDVDFEDDEEDELTGMAKQNKKQEDDDHVPDFGDDMEL